MPNSIEDIIIEIESDSSEAVSQLDILTERLRALKKVTSGSASLANYAKNFEALSRTLSWMNTIDPAKVESIKNFAEGAASLKGITISKTIGEQLEKINNSVMNFSPEAISTISEIANSMFLLKEMQGFVYPSGLNKGLENTAKLAEQISGNDFTKLRELVDIVRDLGTISTEDSSSVKQLSSSMREFASVTKTASTRGRTFNSVLANIRTRTLGLFMGLRWISRGMTNSLSVYGNYVEALNLYKMAVGEAAGEEYEFAENAQKLLGIDLTQWMQAQGVFNALAKGFGVANDKATLMSRNLTQLAYDISSFYNISVEDAIQKVQSGFAGQIRPVRNLGYDLSQARLEAIALANGIDKEVKSMTQGEKSQLRYIALMTQLTEVQGDLARTLDSPTNQMRLLNAQLDQMQRSIGLLLLPLLNKMIPYLNAALRVIRMIAEEIAAMFGYTLPRLTGTDFSTNISMGADEIEESFEDATSAAEKLKNTLASFDQINLITSSSDSGGNGKNTSNTGSDLGLDLPSYDFLGDVTENQAQKIAEDMMKKLRPYIETLKDTIMWTYNHIDDIGQLLTMIAVVTIGKHLIDNVRDAWKWFSELNNIVKGIGLITIGFQLSYLGGKNLAEGNILTGLLESTLGAAAAAYGGKLLLGSVGLGGLGIMLGVGLSLMFTIKGFENQKYKEYVKIVEDIAYDFDEARGSVEDFVEAWNTFADGLTTPAFTEAFPEGTVKEIQEAATSLDQLRTNYTTGLISATAYCQGLSVMFGQLKDSILKYAEESTQALNTMLEGSYGTFLQTHQLSVTALSSAYTQSMNNVTASFSAMQMQMDMLNTQYQLGLITEDEMVQKTDELLKSMTGLVGETNLTSEAVKTFADFSNGLNFVSMNNVLDTLTQIDQKYAETYGQLTKEKSEIKSMLEYGKQNALPALQGIFDNALALTDEYYKGQFGKLDDEYRVGMGVIENTINDNLLKVFNKEGIDGVTAYFIEDMAEIREAISESYSSKHLDPNNSFYSEFDKLIQKTREAFEKMGWDVDEKGAAAVLSLLDSNKDIQRAYEDLFGTYRRNREKDVSLTDDYVRTLKGGLGKLASSVKESTKEINYNLGGSGEYVDSILGKLPISAETRMSMMNSVIKNKGFAIGQNTKGIANDMVNTISKMDLPDEMQRVLTRAQDMIKPADFGLKGASVTKNFMDSFKKDFTPVQTVEDFKRKFAEMFQGDDANKWGTKLGESVKSGISMGLSGADDSIDFMLEGMAQSLNKFGDASFQYWTGMSSAIQAVWNAVKFDSTGKAYSTLMGAWAKASSWHIKGYASGGFPNSADFFYANENGVPELVGTMGGRAAVANNTEITKGVAEAVYKAIKETGIANDVRKIASKDGKIVFAPSEEAGRVVSQSVNMYNRTGGRY